MEEKESSGRNDRKKGRGLLTVLHHFVLFHLQSYLVNHFAGPSLFPSLPGLFFFKSSLTISHPHELHLSHGYKYHHMLSTFKL